MRILLVTAVPGHGSARQVVNLAEEMRRAGHEVHIIYSERGISDDFRSRLAALPGVHRRRVDMRRNPHPADVAAAARIRAYIHRNGPFDVVHGHSSKGGALARLAALGSGAVRVYTPHAFVTMDPLLSRARHRLFGAAEHVLGRLSDAIIVVSGEEKAEALRLGISEGRIFPVAPAVAAPAVRPGRDVRRELGFADDDVCIGFIGRLVDQKAPDRILRAFELTAQADPRLRLLVVGGGPAQAQLAQDADRAGLSSRIVWAGDSPSAPVFSAIDILVQPSRYEGLSAAVVEAMILGIPVIVTDCGGMRALVEHEVNGFVFEQAEERALVQGLADAISALARDPARRRRMGEASRHRCLAFEPARVAADTLMLYRRLARAKATAGGGAGSRRRLDDPPPTLQDYRDVAGRRPPAHARHDAAPLVSVITVTLDAAKTLERTIASVQAQTYPAIEHLVVDGGSTDGTLDILRSRLRTGDYCISERDRGISDAFNKGIALARGEYIQITNADDWLSSNQIEVAAGLLAASGADFVFGDCLCYEDEVLRFRSIGDSHYPLTLDSRMPTVNHSSMLVRSSVYQRFGLFALSYRNAMDYEWLVRVHRAGARGVYDPGILAHMDLGGVSIRQFRRTMREVRQIAIAYGRNRLAAELECRYRLAKTGLSHPIKRSCRPLYELIRAAINPSYRPIR